MAMNDPQPDARARLDWEAALRILRAHASPYFATKQLDAAFDTLVDAVEALCVECGREAVETYCRDELLDDTYETIARRLVRRKDGDDEKD
jgi:riboflavin biosynthesis pyrimidine reductase